MSDDEAIEPPPSSAVKSGVVSLALAVAIASTLIPGVAGIEEAGFVLIAASLLAAFAFARGRKPMALDTFDLALFSYVALSLAACFVHRAQPLALAQIARELAVLGLIFAGARWLRARDVPRLYAAIAVAAFVVALTGLLEALGVAIPWSVWRRPASLIGERNATGNYLAIALPVLIVWAAQRASWWRPLLPALALAVLLLTRCRAAWLALAAGVIVMAVLTRGSLFRGTRASSFPSARGRLAVVFGLAIACVSLISWPGLYWTEERWLTSSLSRAVTLDAAARGRVESYRLGFAAALRSPFVGLGIDRWPEAANQAARVHGRDNARAIEDRPPDVVRVAINAGLIALALAAVLFLFLLRAAWRKEPGAAGALVVFGALAVIDGPGAHPELLALLATLGAIVRRADPLRALISVPSWAPAIFAAAIIAVAAAPRFLAPSTTSVAPRVKIDDARLERAATEAAREHNIPREILLGIAEADSRGVEPWIRFRRWRPTRSAARAATLLGKTEDQLLRDPELGLHGAAALIAATARERATWPSDQEAWRTVIERWNGAQLPLANALYAAAVIPGSKDPPWDERPPGLTGAAFAKYLAGSPRGYRPPARPPRPIRYIVVHLTENDFPTIIDFLARPTTGVGAHYLLRAADGLTVQLADERDVVFHDACFNEMSIGIEHEGYLDTGDRWLGDPLYAASARLIYDVAERHGIPLDRAHIFGHSEAPDCSDHRDPGPHWEWDRLMSHLQDLARARSD